jgi:hypothetical protein
MPKKAGKTANSNPLICAGNAFRNGARYGSVMNLRARAARQALACARECAGAAGRTRGEEDCAPQRES